MNFLTKLVVEEADKDSMLWVLVKPLVYTGNEECFTVPPGFTTDFASVPRFLWSIVPPYGRYTKAAVIHDYFYVSGCISRLDADRLFRRIMKELGVGWLKRNAMYRAVRLFGSTKNK